MAQNKISWKNKILCSTITKCPQEMAKHCLAPPGKTEENKCSDTSVLQTSEGPIISILADSGILWIFSKWVPIKKINTQNNTIYIIAQVRTST